MKGLIKRAELGEKAEYEIDKKSHLLWLDRLALLAGVLSPLIVLPQLYEVISSLSAQGVSLWTWLISLAVSLIWVIYGLAHKEKLVIIPGLAWVVMESALIFAILIYS